MGYTLGINLAEHRAEITNWYENGKSVTQMALDLGCSTTSLSRALARWGLRQKREGRRKLTDEAEADVCRRYMDGESTTQIAATTGVAVGTVRDVARRHGLQIYGRGGRFQTPPNMQQEMVEWTLAGKGQSEIARMLGVSQTHVSRVLAHLRVDPVYPRPYGSNHHSWRGGRSITDEGYVLVRLDRDDPFYEAMAKRSGYVLEHRLVMARALGRPLTEHETVHHVDDKDRSNNALENLQLRQGKHGKGAVFVCGDCGSHNLVAQPLAAA